VWSDVVVLPPPALGEDSDLGQRVEDLAIEKLVPEPGVEGLDVAVSPGTARLDEEGNHVQPAVTPLLQVGPGRAQCPPGVLGAGPGARGGRLLGLKSSVILMRA